MIDTNLIRKFNKFPSKVKRSIIKKVFIDSIIKKKSYCPNAELILKSVNLLMQNPENIHSGEKITKLNQGTNHHVFKIEHEKTQYLVKITPLNNSQRLEQEFLVLDFLEKQKKDFSPRGILFKRNKSQFAVLIESWVHGTGLTAPPKDYIEWANVIQHYQEIHAISPTIQTMYLPRAAKNANSKKSCINLINKQLKVVRPDNIPAELKKLLLLMEDILDIPRANQKTTLCRGDGNFSNFILQGDRIVSVDWEYSGWGDPLFDLVSLIAHPSYVGSSLSDIFLAIEYYKHFYKYQNYEKTVFSYLITLFLYWATRYVNLLQNTDSEKSYAWRDRPSLRLQNYGIYINRAENLLKELSLAKQG